MRNRPKRSHRIIAIFLTLNFITTIIPINQIFAGNNGPNAPEASGFEPVGATDMVNLSSGDMSYVLPLLEIDGFPVTLSYHAGIPMDMEASWVGLGWNINTGAIARGVVANPDDWGYGKRLNLTYLYGEIDSYSVNVGVGIGKAAEVGVGLSWGSNKSISGSVSASVGPLSASIDTDGNYGVGVNPLKSFKGAFDKAGDDDENSPFGGSLSLSGNVNKGGLAVGIGVGGSSKYLSAGMGVSISSNGIGSSYSIGASNGEKGGDARGMGASISMNSFSAGDYSFNTKGFYIPLQIGIFSFGFGHQKTEVKLAKAYRKYAYGTLYHNLTSGASEDKLYNTTLGNDTLHPDSSTDDYQRRNVYGDVYEQALPQPEEEFIGDYRNQIEKLNFTFAGYDSYDINATGIGGALKPIIGENSILIGEGYDGASIRSSNNKTKVFYHNSKGILKPNKTLSVSSSNPNRLNFSFDGQITENAVVMNNSINNYTGTTLDTKNFINTGSALSSRPRSGSYVETFTNSEIDAGASIMTPASLKTGTNNSPNKINRSQAGYVMEGIGGYKIVTPDGKTYHFAQPVYHYEQIQHNFLNFESMENASVFNSSSKREATPYATHWLLTAITGPDYIDTNNNNFADKEDYGYWVRLDHGQWSNAFAWRSPYDSESYTSDGGKAPHLQSRKHYSTFIDSDVEKSDPGHFLQGRKDLYYLDKIVSKNQTAYFIKDLRYDAFGTSADYIFNPNRISTSFSGLFPQFSITSFKDPIESGSNVYAYEHASYEKEYQLRLDKIIIVNKNDDEVAISKTTGNGIASINELVLPNSSDPDPRYNPEGFFYTGLSDINKIHKLHLSDNVIDVNDVQNFDYSQATKVIKFEHSYKLAKKTPSSGFPNENNIPNPNYGRLTLNSVKTYGRGTLPNANENQLYDFMPPYEFEYLHENLEHEENRLELISGNNSIFPDKDQYKYIRAAKDNWGFINKKNGPDNNNDGEPDINAVDAWSLSKITTPTGATIEVKYEEDDYYIEAFGRRYWENNLRFLLHRDSDYVYITVQNENGFAFPVNFENYFSPGDRAFFDFWLCKAVDQSGPGGFHDEGKVNIFGSIVKDPQSSNTHEDKVFVHTVDMDEVVLKINRNNRPAWFADLPSQESYSILHNSFSTTNIIFGDDPNRVTGTWFSKNEGSNDYFENLGRGECPDRDGGITSGSAARDHAMRFKLLANKVPPGKSGGGLRVKDIVVNDDLGHKYITRYDYNDPFKGRSSGITSFNPIRGEVFVPYQNELPGPGVMYEWVTMKAIQVDDDNEEKEIGSTRYHYYTLNPYFYIFDPNIKMVDIDGDPIFMATVEEASMSFSDMTAKDMKIEKNLTKIGQLISIEEFNEVGHLMSMTTNTYQERDGELSETFSSMKSVFDYKEDEDEDYEEYDFDLQQHYLSLSTKSEKVSVLKSVKNVTAVGESEVIYSNPDEYLGTYTTSIRKLSDGTFVKEKKLPAYKKYPVMGSKILNSTNKNMLTQETMSTTSWSQHGNSYGWETLNANITTWKDNWAYRDNYGTETEENGVWRKHKNFVWKDDVDPDKGTYLTNVDTNYNTHFNWSTGDPNNSGEPTNHRWKNVSEVTRYTHWSSPVESRDINNNFAASKMADDFSKVVAGGNAKYTELYYSGAEYVDSGNNFEGEIEGANYRYDQKSHTGKYSLKLTNPSQKGFGVTGSVGIDHDDLNADFRPGVYKVSVWSDASTKSGTVLDLMVNNKANKPSEMVEAGNWTLLNYYITLEKNSDFDAYFKINDLYSSINISLDDFRMHPVYSSMNSYVYDQNTDELSYILDSNNLATKYVYDNAGRLCKVYKEVVTNMPETNGGFKLVNQYRYNYQGPNDDNNCDCCGDDQIETSYSALTIKSLEPIDKGSYVQKFKADARGGSGDFTYEWRWITNVEPYNYTEFIAGSEEQDVPFAVRVCDTKMNSYDKHWVVEVKITDNVTGEVKVQKEKIEESGCKFYMSSDKWADLEISTNYESCSELTKYSLRPFVIKPDGSDYSYQYQTYNNVTGAWSGYMDINTPKNSFCGEIYYVPSGVCKMEYSLFQTIQYRVINVQTGDMYQSNILDVYLDCAENIIEELKLPNNENHEKHGVFGNVLEKNANNEVINIYNFKK